MAKVETTDQERLENRPAILVIGSPNVGKRTLLSRLLSLDFEDAPESSSEVLVQGWTLNTKYYTAEVSLLISHLHDGFSIDSLPNHDQIAALVMVFDMNDLSTLAALKEWVSHTDIQNFDILLCIGNKVDLLPGHQAHVGYRRHLRGDKSFLMNSDADIAEYGISETEGSNLLGDEEQESSWKLRKEFLEWFTDRNIEFIEACASNADFDKCLSVDGDLQGLERLYGALSAHMWPGMVLKSGNKIVQPSLPERQELSSEGESDYELEYEILSGGSAEAWDDTEDKWISAPAPTEVNTETMKSFEIGESSAKPEPSTTASLESEHKCNGGDEAEEKGKPLELDDLEQIVSEIGNMRENLRLMPDFQRREMAANLALRMAAMFGDSDGEEGLK